MASPHGLVAAPVEDFQSRHGIFFHEEAHDRLLRVARPRNRDEKKANREEKMPRPGRPADRPKEGQRQKHGAERTEDPGNPPLGIRFIKRLHGRQKKKRRQRGDGEWEKLDGLPLQRTLPPALKKKDRAEEGNQKSVTVLWIDLPLSPEHADRHPPHPRQRGQSDPGGLGQSGCGWGAVFQGLSVPV